MDESRSPTETRPNTIESRTNILSTSISSSPSDPTESRSKWSDIRRVDSNGLRIPRITRRDHFRSFHQLSHRSRSRRYGRCRSPRSHTRLEVGSLSELQDAEATLKLIGCSIMLPIYLVLSSVCCITSTEGRYGPRSGEVSTSHLDKRRATSS